MGGEPLDLAAGEDDAPGIGAVVTGDDVDERRLARAIGSDQPENLAATHLDIHTCERLHAGEGLADAGSREQWGQVLNWRIRTRYSKT